jgi:hypothetical protein
MTILINDKCWYSYKQELCYDSYVVCPKDWIGMYQNLWHPTAWFTYNLNKDDIATNELLYKKILQKPFVTYACQLI